MNPNRKLVLLTAMTLAVSAAVAQQAEPDDAARARDVEASMVEAERALEEAARRVAELSARQLARAGNFEETWAVRADRPALGVTIGGESAGPPVEGVEIQGITPGGAAEDAGLRSGDIITAINGEILSSSNGIEASRKLLDFMNGVEEGDVLEVDYLRNGSAATLQLQPVAMGGPEFDFEFNGRNFTLPVIPDAPSPPHAYGYTWINRHGGHGFGDMEMVELNKNLGRYFGTETGLLIVKAPADNAFTFQDGDVIKSIDGREPKDLHHAVRILSSYEGGETVNFEIMRDKRKQTITIEVPDDRRSFLVPRPAVAPTSVVIAPGLRVWREPDERT